MKWTQCDNLNGMLYSRGLLVVIGNVDDVDGLSLRVFDPAINWDVCMRLVISPFVNGDIVVWIISTLDGVDAAAAATPPPVAIVTVVDACATVVFNAPSIMGTKPPSFPPPPPSPSLSRVNDNDDNDGSAIATCSALSSVCIVFDTTNSFIVPLLWLLFVKLMCKFSIVGVVPLFALKLLLAMTPVFRKTKA